MRTVLLSTTLALGLGAIAAMPASAGGIKVEGPWSKSGDCRVVERSVTRDGVTRTTRQRECADDRQGYRDRGDRYADRRYDREDRYERRDYRDEQRPGINLNLGR